VARGRVLDRRIHTNEELASCPVEARYLYKALIIHADDEGRMKANPIFLKALIFPFDEAIRVDTVKRWRDLLASIGVIKLYAAGGKEYLSHPNWDKWQPLRKDRNKPSDCPSDGEPVATSCQPNVNHPPPLTVPNLTEPNPTKPNRNVVAPKSGALVSDRRSPPMHVQFVEGFQDVYQRLTKSPYKVDKQHWVIADNLIKQYGFDECVRKAKVLGELCREKAVWFTKEGLGSFTLETLSSKWNSIIPESIPPSKEDELLEELRKKEAIRVRGDAIVNGNAKTSDR